MPIRRHSSSRPKAPAGPRPRAVLGRVPFLLLAAIVVANSAVGVEPAVVGAQGQACVEPGHRPRPDPVVAARTVRNADRVAQAAGSRPAGTAVRTADSGFRPGWEDFGADAPRTLVRIALLNLPPPLG